MPVKPVIIGSDIGVYALARAFHERYGVNSTVVAFAEPGPIANSRIIDVVHSGPEPEAIIETMLLLAEEHQASPQCDEQLIALTNMDWTVLTLVHHRAELEAAGYLVPYADAELIDRLSDKAEFLELCKELGIATPATVIQDFSNADDAAWRAEPIPFEFPVIAKTASSSDYHGIVFDGKKKIYEIASQAELDELYRKLIAAGYRGRFLVQDMIPGDDTQMRSVTTYTDSSGRVTMRSSARVLLEERTPAARGNPSAMIVQEIPEILDAAQRLNEAVGWRGFANFDVKLDPRDGVYRFFEQNPRIGRNNYYVTAGGVNVAEVLVDDIVEGKQRALATANREVLYATVPHRLLSQYLLEPSLWAHARTLMAEHNYVHPLRYHADFGPRRQLYLRQAQANHWRKYHTYYPKDELERVHAGNTGTMPIVKVAAKNPATPRPEIFPVILGGDIGVYALARAFNEQYGVKSTVISGAITGPIADSAIIENVTVPDSHNAAQLVDAAIDVVQEALAKDPGLRPILLANSDWLVHTVVGARDRLEAAGYLVPFLDQELLHAVSDKATFAELAEKLGMAVPRTVVVDFHHAGRERWQPPATDLGFPMIAKAASSADYEKVEFPGKAKVFEIRSQEELDDLWRRLRDAGYRGRFVAQEMIPGDDSQMRSITAYVDRNGVVTLLAGGQVLVEEHTPTGLGNPAAIITGDQGEMFDQAKRFLEATGYRGFANFDVKIDPRDGRIAFFEVNPRIGRNNYYVTAAGANVARFVVADQLDNEAVEPVRVENEVLYSILPTGLLLHYVRDIELKEKVRKLGKNAVHPLAYWEKDGGARRRLYVTEAKLNERRKFHKWYPEATETGF